MASKCLVVDACILASAGTKDAPRSTCCREVLEAINDLPHTVAINKEIVTEWNNHQSGWSRQWRVRMMSKRKLIAVAPYVLRDLRDMIDLLEPDSVRVAAHKDVHLIETAVQADRNVISADDKVRAILSLLGQQDVVLKSVMWANPVTDFARCVAWLQSGGEPDEAMRLVIVTKAAAGGQTA